MDGPKTLAVFYVALTDGTELLTRTHGKPMQGMYEFYYPALIIGDEFRSGIRNWIPWAKNPDEAVKVKPEHLLTMIEADDATAEWYQKTLDTIDKQTQLLNEKLKEIGDMNPLDEQDADMNEEEEFQELLTEFMTRGGKKGTVH